MSLLEKLREKPTRTREKILWISVIFLTFALFFLLFSRGKKQLTKSDEMSRDIVPVFDWPETYFNSLKSSLSRLRGLITNGIEDPSIGKEGLRDLQKLKEEDLKKIDINDPKAVQDALKNMSPEEKKLLEEMMKEIQNSFNKNNNNNN